MMVQTIVPSLTANAGIHLRFHRQPKLFISELKPEAERGAIPNCIENENPPT